MQALRRFADTASDFFYTIGEAAVPEIYLSPEENAQIEAERARQLEARSAERIQSAAAQGLRSNVSQIETPQSYRDAQSRPLLTSEEAEALSFAVPGAPVLIEQNPQLLKLDQMLRSNVALWGDVVAECGGVANAIKLVNQLNLKDGDIERITVEGVNWSVFLATFKPALSLEHARCLFLSNTRAGSSEMDKATLSHILTQLSVQPIIPFEVFKFYQNAYGNQIPYDALNGLTKKWVKGVEDNKQSLARVLQLIKHEELRPEFGLSIARTSMTPA
jgi:hypothetical protein